MPFARAQSQRLFNMAVVGASWKRLNTRKKMSGLKGHDFGNDGWYLQSALNCLVRLRQRENTFWISLRPFKSIGIEPFTPCVRCSVQIAATVDNHCLIAVLNTTISLA